MNILRARQQRPVNVGNSNVHDHKRIESGNQARCANCDQLWAFDDLTEKDGRWYCPNDYELNLREANELLAESAEYAAGRPVRYLTIQTPIDGMTQSPAGAITSLTDASGNAVDQLHPLALHTGGSAVTLKLGGVSFTTADTISYTTGISDNSAPALTGTTLWTLSVHATGAVGDSYSLTFNGSTFRNIFRVR